MQLTEFPNITHGDKMKIYVYSLLVVLLSLGYSKYHSYWMMFAIATLGILSIVELISIIRRFKQCQESLKLVR